MNAPIISKQIMDIPLDAEDMALLRQQFKIPKGVKTISLSVFEALVDSQPRYCCWSGGKIQATDSPIPVAFTPTGLAAFNALNKLPFFTGKIAFIELRMGRTPIREKVLRAFRNFPPEVMLCFFGDLAKELDGQMHQSMNVVGFVEVKDCVGIPLFTTNTLQ